MKFLLLLASLMAGAFVGWMSVLGGIWFTMPIFLICAAIVSIKLEPEFRWRLAVFSLGIVAIFVLEAGQFVRGIDEAKQQAYQGQVHLQQRAKPGLP